MTLRLATRAGLCLTTPLLLLSACSQSGGELSEKGQAFVTASAVFVNEIHYDNVGTDTGEAIELAGPAGTDLSAYTLVLYNGANGAPYGTQVLSGVLGDEGAGFGTSVVNYPANGLQNGSPDGIALVHGTEVVLFLSYEGAFTAVGGPADGLLSTDIGVAEGGDTPAGQSLQLVGTGSVYEDFLWAAPATGSLGTLNAGRTFGDGDGAGSGGSASGGSDGSGGSGTGGSSDVCGAPATAISLVQGPGEASPLVGQQVSIEGVVVGDFQGGGAELGGFFVQAETPDADPATSEGVFVFDPGAVLDVAVGERVRVTGAVSEYFGLTEVTAAAVQTCGFGVLPVAAQLTLPVSAASEFESREGMLVSVQDLTVTETFNLGRYGEVALSAGGRLFNATNDAGTTVEGNAQRRILLDDGKDGQNLVPVPYLSADGTLRIGDTVGSLTAVLTYAFNVYRLEPLDAAAVAFQRTNPRPLAPHAVGGDLRVASLNVLNYFTTLNDRGANTAQELERQRTKLVQAVVGLDADVLGLMEIENRPEALDDFVVSVNAALGADVYQKAYDPAFTGTDAIRTAIIYKRSRVEALDLALSDEDPIHNRPPIAQAFSFRGNRFSVVVNHFKSKGSCPASSADINAERGQGCWNVLRTQQAEALVDFIAELQALADDPDVIVLGDLNSYLGEDPIAVLEASGLVNLIRLVPAAERYSYVFNGESGTLDYGMVTPSLGVAGATIWHINADEPLLLDYNTEFNPPGAFQSNAYRSSDHDPVVLGLVLSADPAALLRDLTADTKRLAAAAQLHPGQRLRLLLRLELAEAALQLAQRLEPRSPAAATAHRKIAVRQLQEFVRVVQELQGRGLLSSPTAQELAEEATLLTELLTP